MLEKEFKYYLDHQEDLIKKYKGRYIVIRNDEVIGDYSTESDAYEQSKKKYKVGSFLIQLCSPGKSDYTSTFHSRVII